MSATNAFIVTINLRRNNARYKKGCGKLSQPFFRGIESFFRKIGTAFLYAVSVQLPK